MRPPPPPLSFNSSSPAPRGRWTAQGEGARRQTFSLYKYLVWIRARVAEISLKNRLNAKIPPLTSIVTKISFPPFFRPPGPLTHKRGGDTSGRTRVLPHANFGVNRPSDCREIVDRTNKNLKKNSKTNTSPFALTSEWRVITDLYSAFRSEDTEALGDGIARDVHSIAR